MQQRQLSETLRLLLQVQYKQRGTLKGLYVFHQSLLHFVKILAFCLNHFDCSPKVAGYMSESSGHLNKACSASDNVVFLLCFSPSPNLFLLMCLSLE